LTVFRRSFAAHMLRTFTGVDRGSKITLVGLYANIVLTGAKGMAGWYMVRLLAICARDNSNFDPC
jgi:hypothetical protein